MKKQGKKEKTSSISLFKQKMMETDKFRKRQLIGHQTIPGTRFALYSLMPSLAQKPMILFFGKC